MSTFPYEVADSHGVMNRRIEKVTAAFLKQHQQGRFSAGQLVVRQKGRVIINLAIGEGVALDRSATIKVTPTSLFPVYSAGKPMAALCIALLQQRGLVDLSATVASYLPVFRSCRRIFNLSVW